MGDEAKALPPARGVAFRQRKTAAEKNADLALQVAAFSRQGILWAWRLAAKAVQVVLLPAPNKHRNYDTKEYLKAVLVFYFKVLIYKAFSCLYGRDKCPYQNYAVFLY